MDFCYIYLNKSSISSVFYCLTLSFMKQERQIQQLTILGASATDVRELKVNQSHLGQQMPLSDCYLRHRTLLTFKHCLRKVFVYFVSSLLLQVHCFFKNCIVVIDQNFDFQLSLNLRFSHFLMCVSKSLDHERNSKTCSTVYPFQNFALF